MKNLITLVALTLLTLGTVQADVTCEKRKGRWYPANDKAKQIATLLKVKTCTGRKFNEVLKKLNIVSNVPKKQVNFKALTVEQVVQQLK